MAEKDSFNWPLPRRLPGSERAACFNIGFVLGVFLSACFAVLLTHVGKREPTLAPPTPPAEFHIVPVPESILRPNLEDEGTRA